PQKNQTHELFPEQEEPGENYFRDLLQNEQIMGEEPSSIYTELLTLPIVKRQTCCVNKPIVQKREKPQNNTRKI
ncbi:MAG TPA: hypothetical protein VJC03_08405, partial [bacterium]|nr:hypothetical protein [bacterium]